MINSDLNEESLNIDLKKLISSESVQDLYPRGSVLDLETTRQRLLLQKNRLNREIQELSFRKETMSVNSRFMTQSKMGSSRKVGWKSSMRESTINGHRLLLDEIKKYQLNGSLETGLK